MKWLPGTSFVLALIGLRFVETSFSAASTFLSLIAAACAMVFACSVCVFFSHRLHYLYLSRNDK
jgi:hypothetical protein